LCRHGSEKNITKACGEISSGMKKPQNGRGRVSIDG